MKKLIYTLLLLFFVGTILGKPNPPLKISDINESYFLDNNFLEYAEQFNSQLSSQSNYETLHFTPLSNNYPLISTQKSACYWIKFKVKNTTNTENFRLEFYDHDIDSILIFKQQNNEEPIGTLIGSNLPFATRDLYHKNLGLNFNLNTNDELTFIIGFKSTKANNLKPVIKSLSQFYKYSLLEYIFLGIYYGFVCLVLIFTLSNYLILKEVNYLYYFGYMLGIALYLSITNGTAFQFLWPKHASLNYWLEITSSSLALICIYLFSFNHIKQHYNVQQYTKIVWGICIFWLLHIPAGMHCEFKETMDFTKLLGIQALLLLIPYFTKFSISRWLIVGFLFLDLGFLISFLEKYYIIPSSFVTVYVLYFASFLQFICILISLAISVKMLGIEKSYFISEVKNTKQKNEELRLLLLKKQMNPHFVFNALNSIQSRILIGDKTEAADYLVKFSKLIRKTLDQSEELTNTLDNEIDTINNYVALENMRLETKFNFKLHIDPTINTATIQIPSFIIQPFIENAIWHGLARKTTNKCIDVFIKNRNNDALEIVIQDNGIGREASKKYKLENHSGNSKGIEIITERINLHNGTNSGANDVVIEDLYDTDNNASGTRVTLKLFL